MSLAEFPSEIIIRILRFSDEASLQTCHQVCRVFRDLVNAELYLDYLHELELCGYVLPQAARTDIGYAQKIRALREHRAQMKRPELRDPTYISLPSGRLRYRPHLADGILSYLIDTPKSEEEKQGTGSGEDTRSSDNFCSIHFHQLPSWNKGTEYKHWSHEDFGIPIEGYSIHPKQDLLVLLEKASHTATSSTANEVLTYHIHECVQLHFRTISTNKPHPTATSRRTIDLNLDTDCSWPAQYSPGGYRIVQIYGHLVAIVTRNSFLAKNKSTYREIVFIVDWVAGVQLACLTIDEQGDRFCCFLSEEYFVISRLDEPLEEPLSGQPQWFTGRLDVYCVPSNLNGNNAQLRDAYHAATFSLPQWPAPPNSVHIEARYPTVPLMTCPSSNSSAPPAKVFQTQSNLLSISITITGSSNGVLRVSSHDLLAIINQKVGHKPNLTEPSNPLVLPWEAWGCSASWFGCHGIISKIYPGDQCSNELREALVYIQGGYRGPNDEPPTLITSDFNPGRVKQAGQVGDIDIVGEPYEQYPDGSEHQNSLNNAFLRGVAPARRPYTWNCKPIWLGDVLTISDWSGGDIMMDDEHLVLHMSWVQKMESDSDETESGAFIYSL